MCLILFAAGVHPKYSLIVAANRDEAYKRPAASAAFWRDHPHVYGGRDLEHGGTWLAITSSGRFSAITNYRQYGVRAEGRRSRGELTRNYLAGTEHALPYIQGVAQRGDRYRGFSLIAGELDRLYFYSNRGGSVRAIAAGVHGLSNHLLDEPWPKVRRGIAVLTDLLGAGEQELTRTLFELLADRTPAPDHLLPQTGIGRGRERTRSASFIASENYGTRASTVLLVGRNNELLFCERTFDAGGVPQGSTTSRFIVTTPTALKTEAKA